MIVVFTNRFIPVMGCIEKRTTLFGETNIENVVDKFVDAIFDERPRSHYFVGKSASMFMLPLSIIPIFMADLAIQPFFPTPHKFENENARTDR